MPSAAIGMRVDIKSTSFDICPNCSGVSKFTTFLTSAMTDSNWTAGCTRP
jgi:Zn-finger nucleic acid-binding protein